MDNNRKREERPEPTKAEMEEMMRRRHEFWWGKRRPFHQPNENKAKKD
ncbi:hypothetical protein JOC78_003107 [Bacillus ectoiniformans]|nr:hypothetical protein [Bacillus ectoiniformans]MBM7650123.1 hypothetical protein [Bacillus ectoiniformans]